MKKNLNAATIPPIIDIKATAVIIIALAAGVILALNNKDQGAKPGKILAKSEMTKQEIANLNVLPIKSEKRHALR